jgi:hypothetical protein
MKPSLTPMAALYISRKRADGPAWRFRVGAEGRLRPGAKMRYGWRDPSGESDPVRQRRKGRSR